MTSGGGTPSTWAPEVAAGKDSDKYKSADWWSIGIVIYQMMYQRAPFDAILTKEKDETDKEFSDRTRKVYQDRLKGNYKKEDGV